MLVLEKHLELMMIQIDNHKPVLSKVEGSQIINAFRPMPMAEEVLEVLAPRRKQHMLDWMQMHYVLPE